MMDTDKPGTTGLILRAGSSCAAHKGRRYTSLYCSSGFDDVCVRGVNGRDARVGPDHDGVDVSERGLGVEVRARHPETNGDSAIGGSAIVDVGQPRDIEPRLDRDDARE